MRIQGQKRFVQDATNVVHIEVPPRFCLLRAESGQQPPAANQIVVAHCLPALFEQMLILIPGQGAPALVIGLVAFDIGRMATVVVFSVY